MLRGGVHINRPSEARIKRYISPTYFTSHACYAYDYAYYAYLYAQYANLYACKYAYYAH